MCGIAGCFSKNLAEQNGLIIDQVLKAQHARGPDNLSKEKISLPNYQGNIGHNRLKIIDLSSHANQPMWNADKNICLTFNGEIYNYLELRKLLEDKNIKFTTSSDTEVLLAAYEEWGIDCLSRFNGPFAFALYDQRKHQLILARDRFGKKPLFYFNNNNEIYFASSASALAKNLKLNPNFEYLARGLKYNVYEDDSDISPFQNLSALHAGNYLCLDLHNFSYSLHPFYSLKECVDQQSEFCRTASSTVLTDTLFQTLDNAIEIRLRADVPVGLSLSGGLDSSIVAAIASSKLKQMSSFTFGDPSLDITEAPLASKFTKKLPISSHFTYPNASDFTESFFKTIDIQDGPFPNFSIVAQHLTYQLAKQNNIRVLLGGQGADEGFMGYRKFHFLQLKKLLKSKNYPKTMGSLFYLSLLLFSEKSRIKNLWKSRGRFLNDTHDSALNITTSTKINLSNYSNLANRQIEDIRTFSLPTLLRYEDRNSMANNIESRLPFMDHRLIELGVALPIHHKLNKGYGKWILREISESLVPDFIRMVRYKRGFDIPTKAFIHAGIGNVIRERLNSSQRHIKDYIAKKETLNVLFSDKNLSENPARLAEAITLMWLINLLG